MFEILKEKIMSIDGIKSMSKEELYFASKWYEEGAFSSIEIPEECIDELITQCCLNL